MERAGGGAGGNRGEWHRPDRIEGAKERQGLQGAWDWRIGLLDRGRGVGAVEQAELLRGISGAGNGRGHGIGQGEVALAVIWGAGGSAQATGGREGLQLLLGHVELDARRGAGGERGGAGSGDGLEASERGRLRDWLGISAKVDVLAVLAELASVLAVEAADLVGVDAEVLAGVGRLNQGVHSGGSTKGHDAVGLDSVGSKGGNLDALVHRQEAGGVEITVKGAAGLAGGGLGAELVDESRVNVDLMAAGAGIAAALLEKQAEGQIFGITRAVLGDATGFMDVLLWDGDLAGAVARVDDLNALGNDGSGGGVGGGGCGHGCGKSG